MERLPREVLKEFLLGQHVMRHRAGIWNGIWSDMFIETTFMRYGHGPGGIIGLTLKPSTLNRWALSLHICSQLKQCVSVMCNGDCAEHLVHKEELAHRIKADALDREKIRAKLTCSVNPLDPSQHKGVLINIISGRLAPSTVNVDRSLSIGQELLVTFESSWPAGFYATLPRKVVTMLSMRKKIKVGNIPVYDTNLIYSRVVGLQSSRSLGMDEVLKFELSPVPSSMFEENGDMRIAKNKSVMKRLLQVPSTHDNNATAVVVDGSALLWTTRWPVKATAADFADNFERTMKRLLQNNDVYPVFDRSSMLNQASKDKLGWHGAWAEPARPCIR